MMFSETRWLPKHAAVQRRRATPQGNKRSVTLPLAYLCCPLCGRSLTSRHQIDPFFLEVRDASVGDVADVLHACSLQERGGECAPDTAGAGYGHRPNDVPDLFRYPLAQPLIGNVYRPLDVPHFPLFWAANV